MRGRPSRPLHRDLVIYCDFADIYTISKVLSIVLYSCVVSNICRANLELCPLFFMSRMCSLNLTLKVRPVCPIYFNGQPAHCSYYFCFNLFLKGV
jgi:hypothetical protein